METADLTGLLDKAYLVLSTLAAIIQTVRIHFLKKK